MGMHFVKYLCLPLFFISLYGASHNIAKAASTGGTCAAWGCEAYIYNLTLTVTGTLYIETTADETLANCSPTWGKAFVMTTADAGFDGIYSTLLTAQAAEKKIKIVIIESGVCPVSYIEYSATN